MGPLSFLPGLAVMAVALAVIVFIWAGRRKRAIFLDKERYPGLVALCRSTMTARYIGLGAGVAVFVGVLAMPWRLGRGLFLAPAAAGTVLILAVLVGQRLAYGYARDPGVAAVEHRLVRNYLPRRLTLVVLLVLLALLAAAAWTTLAASRDDFGLKRAFSVAGLDENVRGVQPGTALVTVRQTPFPGSFYTSMLGIGLPIVLALGMVALWVTARRPRNGADPNLVAVDDLVRKQTSEGIVAALGVAVSLSLLGIALVSMEPVWDMRQFGISYTLGGIAFGMAAALSLVAAAWCMVLVLVPGTGRVKSL